MNALSTSNTSKFTDMTAAKRYATENGFSHCRYYRDWYSYHVYVVGDRNNAETPCAGFPTLVLDGGDYCRFAEPDETRDIMSGRMVFYKEHKTDMVFWVDNPRTIGEHLFSFDQRKIYNLFRDYPHRLTAAELETFNRENPYWVKFFRDRLDAK